MVSGIPTPYNDALFRHLARQPGVELTVAYCSWREGNRSWDLERDKGYDYTVLPGRSFGDPVHLNPGVGRHIRRVRPDVAVLTGSYTTPTIQLAAWSLRIRCTPWVYWSEELSLEPLSGGRRLVRDALRRTLLSARGVFAIGSRARESFRRVGVPEERIADFRYYADVERFRGRAGDAAARAEVRAELGLAGGGPVFLFVGQMVERKGVDTLVRAVAALRRAGVACTAVLAGDGPQQDEFRALAGELGVAGAVRFTGFVQPRDLPRLFAAGDVFVLPSRREGWGVVVHEALAAGLPVIASDQVNSAVDLLAEGECGWLFAAGDPASLAARMREYCGAADPARLSAEARRVAERHAPERVAPRMASLLAAVLAGVPVGRAEREGGQPCAES